MRFAHTVIKEEHMPKDATIATETSAEQHARRCYRRDHFASQADAERAYFRLLAEWLARGQEIARLARRLGAGRGRARALRDRYQVALTELANDWRAMRAYLLEDDTTANIPSPEREARLGIARGRKECADELDRALQILYFSPTTKEHTDAAV